MEPVSKHTVYELSELTYRWQQVSNDYVKRMVDYGTGELYTSAEVHVVTRIEENPGITVTEIAESSFRTKSAVSQMVTKLEKKNLIIRCTNPENTKQKLLYVTPKGLELSKCHKIYDENTELVTQLIDLFGSDLIDKFAEILTYSTNYMLNQLREDLIE